MHFARMLEGRRALILGGASAVGGAVARLFAAHGSAVALADAPGDAPEALRRENPELLTVAWDGTSRAISGVCARVLEAFGFADILVGATDAYKLGPLADVSTEDFQRMLDTNFYAVVSAFQGLLPKMLQRRRGELVLMAPDTGTGAPAGAAVAACSGALRSFARNVSMDYIRYRVRANTVLYPLAGEGEGVPLTGRPEPIDAANAALWYACDLSRFVLGEALPVNGGLNYARAGEAAI